jgi:hypothetical protein
MVCVHNPTVGLTPWDNVFLCTPLSMCYFIMWCSCTSFELQQRGLSTASSAAKLCKLWMWGNVHRHCVALRCTPRATVSKNGTCFEQVSGPLGCTLFCGNWLSGKQPVQPGSILSVSLFGYNWCFLVRWVWLEFEHAFEGQARAQCAVSQTHTCKLGAICGAMP